MEELEKRMYFLVPYNISPIQQAIQAGHAALEYAHKFGDDPEYVDFIENWKTWIILNGGTTNNVKDDHSGEPLGTMNQAHFKILKFNKENPDDQIKFSMFKEPDLNNALTAICIVVDERVFNREDYPSFEQWLGVRAVYISQGYNTYLVDEDKYREEYKNFIGGEKILFLKELFGNKKLA